MDLSNKILSDLTVHMKYAKYIKELQRRETWGEIVERNKAMHIKKFPNLTEEIDSAYQYVMDKKVLPSMRSMQFAGKPVAINNSRIFNCSFLPMSSIDGFSELMFLLLSGCGVGYSVQKHHVKKVPAILKYTRSRKYLVADSIEGWADSIKILLRAYMEASALPVFDFSDIRPKGSKLVTSGGKAPGPEPLRECLLQIQSVLETKQNGDKLSPLEVHDICCFIADAVLAGGIRRSACLALFSMTDEEMISCKGYYELPPVSEVEANGTTVRFYVEYRGHRKIIVLPKESYDKYLVDNLLPWYHVAPQRARSNNSAMVLRHKIDKPAFLDLWKKIEDSGSGEPGFFLSNNSDMGTNPCGEVSLRSFQMCNLVEINVSDVAEGDQDELELRAKTAAFIATLQASYTDFHYLRDEWKDTTDKEALIGVSMTGIASGGVLKLDLEAAATVVKKENLRVAKLIGINKSARCTVVKPAGTTSLVLGSSSGIHAWHNKYYLRRVRVGKDESIYSYLAQNHPELIEDEFFRPMTQAVISVPQKAPDEAITRSETALELLDRVRQVWTTWIKPGHRSGDNVNNVSATITIKPNEWKEVGEWMWDNRNSYTALSVLPYSDHEYIQAPFEDITKKQYDILSKTLHEIDLTKVVETEDETNLQGELACAGGGGSCEIR